VAELSRFYTAQDQPVGTHLALVWKGRVRYTVPRESAGQRACWDVFKPGRLGIALQAKVKLPRLLGSVGCVESERLAWVRDAIGSEAGLSSCRAGAAGPWSKDTVVLLDKKTIEPIYIVKAGAGEEVAGLLQNEASWLKTLHDLPSLADHVPELVAHHAGAGFCFVAQRALSGERDFTLGKMHLEFLRKLQEYSLETKLYEDSRLCRTLNSRISGLQGLLNPEWAARLDKSIEIVKESFSGKPLQLVASHNDFTPWNTRLEREVARVFDWEYAEYQQLPLFDALHFNLIPMALSSRPTSKMLDKMDDTIRQCKDWLGDERCYQPKAQALTYMVNLSTLYLWAERGKCAGNSVLGSYARIIDHLCRTGSSS
jgi:hypothetical protein